jgi:hypothetical protein
MQTVIVPIFFKLLSTLQSGISHERSAGAPIFAPQGNLHAISKAKEWTEEDVQ